MKIRILLAFLLLSAFGYSSASGELLLSFKQTGSDVTATLSGTITAAWGTDGEWGAPWDYGSLSNASGGWTSYNAVNLKYGSALDYPFIDLYYPVSSSPQFSGLSGATFSGGVVQPGSTLTYLYFDVGSTWYWLEVAPGITDLGTSTIVWSNKQLTDFFTTGTPLQTDIYNSSDQKLMTLEIGEFAPEPIPEPGTWAAAALLVGGAAFMRWRRRQTA